MLVLAVVPALVAEGAKAAVRSRMPRLSCPLTATLALARVRGETTFPACLRRRGNLPVPAPSALLIAAMAA